MESFKLFALTVFIGLFINCEKNVTPSEHKVLKNIPSKVIDLENWKITIPFDQFGKDGSESKVAHEIKQDALNAYILDDFYFVNSSNDGVVFRAHAGGAHTSGSGYPRCEFREMTNGKEAKWQSSEGKHILEIEQAINAVPDHKKHVVAGQIHSTGEFDDVITCRLEDKKLFLSHNGKAGTTLTMDYILGTRFKIKWVVENNEIKSYFDDKLIEAYALKFPDSYFKAGCYTQSASWGKNDKHNADPQDFGEVVIYKLDVSHN
ncbi:Alginate lyase [Spirosomataceae bacterium TFI 002]|nr:Alginate lyase [Spirosomataceae bacterium TFI 002]